MEIVPKLDLNRNPKEVKCGSLIAAKNVMTDDSGSYFTNEYGFGVSFETNARDEGSDTFNHPSEYIVGVIPCNKEIVIFTYSAYETKARIYRKPDNGKAYEVSTNWEYHGGKITGTYTYNYKGELIIVVAESGAVDLNNNNIQVPLKTWNLDVGSTGLEHGVEENIPSIIADYKITNGSLNCGVYTFFIRYQIDDYNYTKWFQITDDIIIINDEGKDVPIHNFLNSKSALTHYNVDELGNHTTEFEPFLINGNDKSNKGVYFTLDIDKNYKFTKYQIGYIVKHNDAVDARIFNTYSIDITTLVFNTNTYIEEESVDEMLREPVELFDVKNVINYNNRIYISNYKENLNEDLTGNTKNVHVDIETINVSDYSNTVTTTKQLVITTNFAIGGATSVNDVWAADKYTVEKNDEVTEYVIKSEYITEFIRKFFTSSIKVFGFGTAISIDHDKITNIPNASKNEPYLSRAKFELWIGIISSGTSKQVCIYDSHVQKAVNISKIVIRNGYIVITVAGTEYLINKSTDFQVLIEQDLFFAAASMQTQIGFYNQPLITGNNYHYNAGYGMNSSAYEATTISSANATSPFNNFRSLIPGQIYSFYIHYIRKDGSATNGFIIQNKVDETTTKASGDKLADTNDPFDVVVNNVGNKLFRVPTIKDSNLLVFPRFKVDSIPNNYIGWFCTYEKVEDMAYPCIVEDGTLNGNRFTVTNTNFEYKEDSIQGNKYFKLDDDKITDNNTESLTNHIKATIHPNVSFGIVPKYEVGTKVVVYNDNKDVYNKAVKTLYRITDNHYVTGFSRDNFKYVPGFYNQEKIVTFDKELIINPTASFALNPNSQKLDGYVIALNNGYNYNKYPTNAYSIKQDYNEGAVSLTNEEGKALGIYYNKVLSPDRLRDFLELKECYKSTPLKSYTNYSKDYIDSFDKTIRRSNVISDESLVNGFKNFDVEQYKIITENKGSITNIVGIGLYMLVHTEYSLFVFDRTPKLTQKSQLEVPDVFDIDYQEVLPSNEGFGGLARKDESIISKHGYIWFDSVNRIIFKFENGKAEILSTNINNLLKSLNIDYVVFGEDLKTNRLLICIWLNQKDTKNNKYYITLSYNFNLNDFISLHDYAFTANYRTYNKSYFFNDNVDKARLYEFDESETSYKNLASIYNVLYPTIFNK
nr:MAG TPA: stabilization protein [Crassvirales sp.]